MSEATLKQTEAVLRFIKEAFCIDGTTECVNKTETFDAYIKCTDKKRGTFLVAMKKPTPPNNQAGGTGK